MRKGVAAKYATVEELVRGFDNAQQLIGRPSENLYEITADMKPEAQRAILEKLGLPKDVSGYKLEAPKDAGDIFKMDHPNMQALTAEAHKLGVTPTQLQGLLNTFGGQVAAGQKEHLSSIAAKHAGEVEALRGEWGETFDANVAKANLAITKLGGNEEGVKALREAINNSGLGTNGPLLKAMVQVGELLSEAGGGGDKGDFSAGGGQHTPDALIGEATRLQMKSMNTTNIMEQRDLQAQAQVLIARAEKSRKR